MRKISLASFIVTVAILSIIIGIGTPPYVHAKARFVTIGTGGVTGMYYPTGGAISKIVNMKKKQYNLKVTVESTGGSVSNINLVMSGDCDFGIAQADRQHQAWNALAEWKKKGPQKDLRTICALYPESLTLMAGDDTNIWCIKDLKGKHVNIGGPGSGMRQNSIDVLTYVGLDYQKDMKSEEIKSLEAPKYLLDGRIDASFITIGHPSANIKETTSGRRKIHIVPITGIDGLLKKFPYYAKCYINMKHYPMATNKEDKVPTFGMKATLVTSTMVPEDIVYAITKELFENLDKFKSLHPGFESLTRENMLEGLAIPFHDGALRYLKEVGLVK